MKRGEKLRREPLTGMSTKSLLGLVGPDGRLKPGVMPGDCNMADPRSMAPLFGYKDHRYFAQYIAPSIGHLRLVLGSNGAVLFRATHSDSGDLSHRRETLVQQTIGAGPITDPSSGGC